MPRRFSSNVAEVHSFALQVLKHFLASLGTPLRIYFWVIVVAHLSCDA